MALDHCVPSTTAKINFDYRLQVSPSSSREKRVMAGVSKIAASVLSATNDNTLALGSLKLDFSLIKYEAPVEFSGLGAALSSRRRTDAEDGLHHKTARRLAALFEQLIPSTKAPNGPGPFNGLLVRTSPRFW